MFYHQGRPFEMAVEGDAATILLSMPWPALAQRLPEAARLTATRLGGGTTFVELAASVLRQLVRMAPDAGPAGLARVSAAAIDIVVAAVEVELGGQAVQCAGNADLLRRAKAFIRANLQDPALGLDAIAAALGISRRTLNRLFVAEGTAPMRWLWQQRLAASYKALAEGQAGTVTEAAFAAGFNDLSHFSRCFRRAFGRPPSTLKPR